MHKLVKWQQCQCYCGYTLTTVANNIYGTCNDSTYMVTAVIIVKIITKVTTNF
jgi:hypothetical protein